jgi:hypothetical protein
MKPINTVRAHNEVTECAWHVSYHCASKSSNTVHFKSNQFNLNKAGPRYVDAPVRLIIWSPLQTDILYRKMNESCQ